jgi:hypothetical protein
LQKYKTSISILHVEPVLREIMTNRKPRGIHWSVTLFEQMRPTAPPTFGQRLPLLCHAHGIAATTAQPVACTAFYHRLTRL